MVSPISLRCRLGWRATGFTIEGIILFLQLIHDPVHHVLGTQRKSAVHEHRPQPIFGDTGLEGQQRSKLSIAVLFDNKAHVVLIHKGLDVIVKREAADAHVIGRNAAISENFDGLAYGGLAAAKSNHAESGVATPVDFRQGARSSAAAFCFNARRSITS